MPLTHIAQLRLCRNVDQRQTWDCEPARGCILRSSPKGDSLLRTFSALNGKKLWASLAASCVLLVGIATSAVRELPNCGKRVITMTHGRWIEGKGLELASEPVSPVVTDPTRYQTQLVQQPLKKNLTRLPSRPPTSAGADLRYTDLRKSQASRANN
jgi:hypothetical protein